MHPLNILFHRLGKQIELHQAEFSLTHGEVIGVLEMLKLAQYEEAKSECQALNTVDEDDE